MAERKALGPVANGRNHTITVVLVLLATGWLAERFPGVAEAQWQILVGAVMAWVLGFGASIWRSYMAASKGVTPATAIGRRLAQWVGCFAAAVLLAGCAFESSKFNLAAADSEAETLSGPKITVTETDEATVSVCEGADCRWRRAISRGFSVPFTAVLGRLIEGAAAFVGASPPQEPQPIEISVEGVTVTPTPD